MLEAASAAGGPTNHPRQPDLEEHIVLTPISRLDAVPKYRARAEAQRQTGHTRVPARLQGLTPSVVVVHAPAGTPRRERRAKLQAARAESRARRRAAATATRVAQRAGALR